MVDAANKKALVTVCESILGKSTGQVVLAINNGGLTNRDATHGIKELFKSEVLPSLNHRNDPANIITGQIVCNISNGSVSMHYKKWYCQNRARA